MTTGKTWEPYWCHFLNFLSFWLLLPFYLWNNMANDRAGLGSGWVNRVAGQTGRVKKWPFETGWNGSGQLGCKQVWADPYFHMKKKWINAKFLERMNQMNQRNKLYIIHFFFFFSLSGHLQLLDYLCKLCYCYTWEAEKNKQTN